MEKLAQDIGQVLYQRGRAGEGAKRRKERSEKDDVPFNATVVSFLQTHDDISDCQDFPIIIKAAVLKKQSPHKTSCQGVVAFIVSASYLL